MYIAMNRFKVIIGSESAFEAVWKGAIPAGRCPGLPGVPPAAWRYECGGRLYAVFLAYRLAQRRGFLNWTKSENFRMAHRNAGDNKALYWGPPRFEGFNVVAGV